MKRFVKCFFCFIDDCLLLDGRIVHIFLLYYDCVYQIGVCEDEKWKSDISIQLTAEKESARYMKTAGDTPIKALFPKTIWMLFPRGDGSKTLIFPDGQQWFALKTENILEPAVSADQDLSNILIREK